MQRNFLFVLLLLASSTLFAKEFANQYCSFLLPPGWDCALEGSEYVCQSSDNDRKREAIIILAAKKRGQQDSLDQYHAYLKDTKTFQLPGGKTQVSEPKYTSTKKVNEHDWVDSLHLASEVPGFYTRYLATVKEDLGVAITLSVAKDFYNAYQAVFDSVVNSLRVFRVRNADASDLKLKASDKNLLENSTYIPTSGEFDVSMKQKKQGAGRGDSSGSLMLYLLLAAVVGFIIMKKLKKKKK